MAERDERILNGAGLATVWKEIKDRDQIATEDIAELNTKVSSLTTSLNAKADASTVSTLSTAVAANTSSISDLNTAVATKAEKSDIPDEYTLPIATETTLGGIKASEDFADIAYDGKLVVDVDGKAYTALIPLSARKNIFESSDGCAQTKHIADKAITAAKIADGVIPSLSDYAKTADVTSADSTTLASAKAYTDEAVGDLDLLRPKKLCISVDAGIEDCSKYTAGVIYVDDVITGDYVEYTSLSSLCSAYGVSSADKLMKTANMQTVIEFGSNVFHVTDCLYHGAIKCLGYMNDIHGSRSFYIGHCWVLDSDDGVVHVRSILDNDVRDIGNPYWAHSVTVYLDLDSESSYYNVSFKLETNNSTSTISSPADEYLYEKMGGNHELEDFFRGRTVYVFGEKSGYTDTPYGIVTSYDMHTDTCAVLTLADFSSSANGDITTHRLVINQRDDYYEGSLSDTKKFNPTYDEQVLNGTYKGRNLSTVLSAEIGSGTVYDALHTRVTNANFAGLRVGDYIDVPLENAGDVTTATSVRFLLAHIDPYYQCGDTAKGHHLAFVASAPLAVASGVEGVVNSSYLMWNTTDTNQGTADEKHPYLCSNLRKWEDSFAAVLPEGLSKYLLTQRVLLEERYSASGTLTDSNKWSWADLGKVWSPSETEVCGQCVWGTKGYSVGFDCQFDLFRDTAHRNVHRIWWLRSVVGGSLIHACAIGGYGHATIALPSEPWSIPRPCFLFG